jgi:hypothetical protein
LGQKIVTGCGICGLKSLPLALSRSTAVVWCDNRFAFSGALFTFHATHILTGCIWHRAIWGVSTQWLMVAVVLCRLCV